MDGCKPQSGGILMHYTIAISGTAAVSLPVYATTGYYISILTLCNEHRYCSSCMYHIDREIPYLCPVYEALLQSLLATTYSLLHHYYCNGVVSVWCVMVWLIWYHIVWCIEMVWWYTICYPVPPWRHYYSITTTYLPTTTLLHPYYVMGWCVCCVMVWWRMWYHIVWCITWWWYDMIRYAIHPLHPYYYTILLHHYTPPRYHYYTTTTTTYDVVHSMIQRWCGMVWYDVSHDVWYDMLCYPSTPSLHTTVPPWSVLCMCYTILHTYYHPYYHIILLIYIRARV